MTNSVADLHKPRELLTVVLTRTLRLFFTEPIISFSCIYLSLIYGTFYLSFEAWPCAYQDIYHMSPTVSGMVAYFPFGVGNIIAVLVSLQYDKYLVRAQEKERDWSFKPEYRRLPLACIGGPFWTASLFWQAWTVRSNVHWAVPMLSGVTLGAGFLLIFIAILNYLSDAYTIHSASAQSISSTTRSILGTCLPLLAPLMYDRLGFGWAGSLLGFLSLAMIPIPFAFIYWGDTLRGTSRFCKKMDEMREEGMEMNTNVLDSGPDALMEVVRLDEEASRPKAGSIKSLKDMAVAVGMGEDVLCTVQGLGDSKLVAKKQSAPPKPTDTIMTHDDGPAMCS